MKRSVEGGIPGLGEGAHGLGTAMSPWQLWAHAAPPRAVSKPLGAQSLC